MQINREGRCPECNNLIVRVDHNDPTRRFYAIKAMVVCEDGSVNGGCMKCGTELQMPVVKIKKTIRVVKHVTIKNTKKNI